MAAWPPAPAGRGPRPPEAASRRDRRATSIARRSSAALLVFVLAWKVVVVVGGYPAFILPPPETVCRRFVGGWLDGTIEPHLAATLVEIALGLRGAGLGPARRLPARPGRALAERVLSPYIVAAQATPILALAPLLALWFGPGPREQGRHLRAHRVLPDRRRHDGRHPVGRRRGCSSWAGACGPPAARSCSTLEIPAALPSILGGLRVGVTLAVVGAIVGEWAGAERGLGVLVNLARGSLFDIPLLFATLLTIALLGVALYVVVVLVERRLVGAR